MVLAHDVRNGELVAVHTDFFEHAGFLGDDAGGVVVLERLEAVGWACGSVGCDEVS